MVKTTTTPTPESPAAANVSSLSLGLPAEPPAGAPQPPVAPEAAPDQPAATGQQQLPIGHDEPPAVHHGVEWMRARGFEVPDDATDDDVGAAIEEWHAASEKNTQLTAELERVHKLLAERERQAAPPQPPAAAQPPATKPDEPVVPPPPQLDELTHGILELGAKQGIVTVGPNGLVTTEDVNLRGYAAKYNEFLIAKRNYEREWTAEKIAERIYEQRAAKDREAIRKELLAEVTGTLSQRDTDTFYRNFKQQNSAWLFSDPAKGDFTPEGQMFAEEVDRLVDAGLQPEHAIERAQAWVAFKTGKTPWAGEPDQPTDTPTARTVKFRNRLKTQNGTGAPAPLQTQHVNRPVANADAATNHPMTFDRKLTGYFSQLMSQKVADRV